MQTKLTWDMLVCKTRRKWPNIPYYFTDIILLMYNTTLTLYFHLHTLIYWWFDYFILHFVAFHPETCKHMSLQKDSIVWIELKKNGRAYSTSGDSVSIVHLWRCVMYFLEWNICIECTYMTVDIEYICMKHGFNLKLNCKMNSSGGSHTKYDIYFR